MVHNFNILLFYSSLIQRAAHSLIRANQFKCVKGDTKTHRSPLLHDQPLSNYAFSFLFQPVVHSLTVYLQNSINAQLCLHCSPFSDNWPLSKPFLFLCVPARGSQYHQLRHRTSGTVRTHEAGAREMSADGTGSHAG